jgi:hypothetical protein
MKKKRLQSQNIIMIRPNSPSASKLHQPAFTRAITIRAHLFYSSPNQPYQIIIISNILSCIQKVRLLGFLLSIPCQCSSSRIWFVSLPIVQRSTRTAVADCQPDNLYLDFNGIIHNCMSLQTKELMF